MLISPAFAQTAGGSDFGLQIMPLVLVFAIFYFLLIRPQQKRAKDHKAMLAGVKRGDRVVTGGGIVGTVVKTMDDELTVEIAENIRVRVTRDTILGLHKERVAMPEAGTAEGEAAEKPSSGSKLRRLLGGK
ncbi:MAG: preprotein translocase subunit YajC [Rhodospirillaceae bacterium]|nr:preprotein translocase subunit YajC [Rhodospirillaceae bacterium]